MSTLKFLFGTGLAIVMQLALQAREWTDASGHYKFDAEFVARNENSVVLEKSDKSMVIIDIADLSKEDKQYLDKLEADGKDGEGKQKWTLANGKSVRASVVEYGSREVIVQRRRDRVHVNDRRLSNLPEFYQIVVPKIVSHFKKVEIDDETALLQWLRRNRGQHKFTVDGVLMELANGDLYPVPFFMFSEQDQKLLKPGWKAWSETKKDKQLQLDQSLQLQALAAKRERQRTEDIKMSRLNLQLQAYSAGLLWEVMMQPPNNFGMPFTVVVPGRNSSQAAAAAQAKHPSFKVGPIARVRPRF